MGLTRGLAATAALALVTGCGSQSGTTAPDARYGHATAGDIALTDGWVTESPAASSDAGASSSMSTVSGAYFTLTNDSGSADALVAARTPDTREAQLHTTIAGADGSAGTMKRVARVVVPAHGSAKLQIGGDHLMLMQPTRTLEAGHRVPVELRFASGTVVDVRLPVLDREDRPR